LRKNENVAVDISQLQAMIASTQQAIGNFTNIVSDSNSLLARQAVLGKTEEEQYAKHLEKVAKWNKAEDAERISYIKQLNKQKDDHAKIQAVLVENQSKLGASVGDTWKSLQQTRKAIQDAKAAAAAADAAGNDVLKRSKLRDAERLKGEVTKLSEAWRAGSQQQAAIKAELERVTQGHKKLSKTIADQVQELGRFSPNDIKQKVFGKLGETFKTGVKNLFSGLSLKDAVINFTNDYRQILATAGDNIYSSLGRQVDAAKLGLTPAEYIAMNAASRQTILAAGGAAKQIDILKDQSDTLGMKFASVGDRTKYVQGQMDALAQAGIRPTKESAGILGGSFTRLQKITGMTGEQFNELTREMATDSDIQIQLRAANSQEREQIMQGIMARNAENRAMGMTAEQAKAVSKTLAKLAGQGPVDRMKQAAKIRAMSGMMGIGGGDEAANILIKGQRATPEEKKILQEHMSKISNAASESQTGGIGQEMMVSTAMDKMGLSSLLGPGSEFNTRLAEGLKIDEKALEEQKGTNTILTKMLEFFDIGKAGVSNPLVQGVGAIGSGIYNAVGGAASGAGGAYAMQKLMGTALPGAGTAASGAASGAAKGGMGSFLKGAGGKILGTVGAVGIGGYEAYGAHSDYAEGKISEKQRNSRYGGAAGGVGGALAGAALGTAILPVVGTIIGGAIGAWAGSSAGEKVGEQFGTDKTKTGTTTAQESAPTVAATSETMTSNLDLQLSKLDESNEHLAVISKIVEEHLNVAKKQLTTMEQIGSNTEEGTKATLSGLNKSLNYSSVA
jgi:uncharacterized membrane protein